MAEAPSSGPPLARAPVRPRAARMTPGVPAQPRIANRRAGLPVSRASIVASGTPHALVESLRGRVWRRVIDKAELPAYRAELNVISTRLREGRTVVHVVADAPPGPGFEPAAAGLEDFYFATLAAGRAAPRAA